VADAELQPQGGRARGDRLLHDPGNRLRRRNTLTRSIVSSTSRSDARQGSPCTIWPTVVGLIGMMR
jgi:hypothetical protein